MKNILHISDLHLSIKKGVGFQVEQAKENVTHILNDINAINDKSITSIDTLFFTGDITFSGKAEEYSAFHECFLSPLLEGLGLNEKDVYMVPGNHDMDRSAIKIVEKSIRDNYSRAQLSEIFDAMDKSQEVWPRAGNYNTYIESFGNKRNLEHNGTLCKVYKISRNLYVMCINSAWLAQDDDDQSRLQVTESQIKILERVKIPQTAKIIGLMHHPLDWLDANDRSIFSTFIEKKVSMLCYGHMHNFNQRMENNFDEGITIFLQAGTLDTREEQSGYSIISFNNSNSLDDGRILYRKFDKINQKYTSWIERGNNGEFNYSTDSMVNFDVSKFADLSSRILDSTDTDLLINTGLEYNKKKRLSNLFTEPNYTEDSSIPLENIKLTSTSQIINGQYNLIIFGGDSSGKTSILKYMYCKGLESQSVKVANTIHFFVDCIKDDIGSQHKITKLLCNTYFSDDLSTNFEDKIKVMLRDGRCTIFIDNINHASKENLKSLFDFIQINSKCRYIIACDKDYPNEVCKHIIDGSFGNFKTTTIGSLRRRNVRDIVSRWEFAIQHAGENKLYNEITKTVHNSQLPHNYFIYSMLLAIFEVDPDIKGILSESDIIENFIEILLKKHIMTTPSDKPQYKELLHFLGYFGQHCFNNQKAFFSYNEVLELALKFNKQMLTDYNVHDFISPLQKSGILNQTKNQITFSQPSFMYYAISYFMRHDHKLKAEVLKEENYLSLDKVIEYYASQNASSLELLHTLQQRTKSVIDEMSCIIRNEKGQEINELDLNSIKRMSIFDLFSSSDDVENYIEKLKSDKTASDNHLDEVAPLSAQGKPCDISIKEQDNRKIDLPNLLLQNLSLYARVFRNTELTMDPDGTIDIFNDIANGYMFYMKSFMLMMDESYVIPYILPALEKKMSEDNLTEKQKNKVIQAFKTILSFIRSVMPNNIQALMSDVIATKKPRIENIIKETRKREENDSVKSAILGYILMDIKDENITSLVNELSKEKNDIVQESLFFKINQVIVSNYDLPRRDVDSLKQTLKDIVNKRKINIPISNINSAMTAIKDDGTII